MLRPVPGCSPCLQAAFTFGEFRQLANPSNHFAIGSNPERLKPPPESCCPEVDSVR